MKALITGILGFVGQYLSDELSGNGYSVHGLDIAEGVDTACVDLLDGKAVRDYVHAIRPDVIYHLAAQASVPLSWEQPRRTYELNVIGAINLLEAVRGETPSCRILMVGSSDQYGATGSVGPIGEERELHPQNPYAASKKAQEEIACVYANAYAMDLNLTRSFNHSGPGQKPGYLITDLCQGIVKVERGEAEYLSVGNLEAARDFTDVRDVVRAYRLIGEKGIRGEIYNVGTGIGRKARDILDMLLGMASCNVPVRQDPARMRLSDTPVFVCDNAKLVAHTKWAPIIPIEQTLHDTLEYYRRK